MDAAEERLRCPTCRAAMRGAATCARCGTDLGPLMVLVAAALRGRNAARQAMVAGRMDEARTLTDEAQERFRTRQGTRLQRLLHLLQAARAAASRRSP